MGIASPENASIAEDVVVAGAASRSRLSRPSPSTTSIFAGRVAEESELAVRDVDDLRIDLVEAENVALPRIGRDRPAPRPMTPTRRGPSGRSLNTRP